MNLPAIYSIGFIVVLVLITLFYKAKQYRMTSYHFGFALWLSVTWPLSVPLFIVRATWVSVKALVDLIVGH